MSSDQSGNKDAASIRRDYNREELLEATVEDNPISQFNKWFEKALSADEILDPTAMTLSTAGKDGKPSSRIVLLKGVDEQGFQFYTNYKSRKGLELEENPQASLCFLWSALERQVRVEGRVEKLSTQESKAYFHQRPRASQLGAWASHQSQKVASRQQLEQQFQAMKERFEDDEIPLPDFWGGYTLHPDYIEFWQGRKSRLHDRICYERNDNGWDIFRLSP